MNTTANTAFSQREDYIQAYERAANELHSRLMRDPEAFHIAAGEPFMLAFDNPARLLSYKLAPTAVTARVAQQTEAAKALHSIWTTFHRNDAELTGRERILAQHLDTEVQRYIEETASAEAEGDEPGRLRKGGAL